MTLKMSLILTQLVLFLFQTSLWAQVGNPKGTTPKTAPVSFDAAIPAFETTAEGKAYIQKYGRKPEIADAFGYPMRKNPLKQQKPKVQRKKVPVAPKPVLRPGPKVLPVKFNPNVKKTTLIENIFEFFISSAHAYDYEEDADGHLSIMNCRDVVPTDPNDPMNPGYFRAYFEDLAYNNGQGSGLGYDHPQFGTGRRNAVCDVLKDIGEILKIDEPGGATPELVFAKNLPPNTPTGALAAASPFYGPASTSFANSGYLHQHIISRNDPADGPDAVVYTNWHPSVSWSVDSSLNPGTFDFKTVMWHEFLHALGFLSRLPETILTTNIYVRHNHWDKNLYLSTTPFLTQSLSPLLQIPVGAPSLWFRNNESIYRGRKNYVNAPFDDERPLFTPSNYQPGSTLHHFDMNRPEANGQTYVMHPSIQQGMEKEIHEHEKEVLCHLGYQVRDMDDCGLPTPVAYDDIDTITSTVTHIPFLGTPNNPNDVSHSGGNSFSNLSLHSLEVITPSPAPFYSFHADVTINPSTGAVECSSSPATFSAAKCIKVETPNTLSMVKFIYQVKDNVSNRISEPALILYTRCNVATDEHICNGNFEMQQLQTGYVAFALNQVPFWSGANISPDIYQSSVPYPQNWVPGYYWANLPYTAGEYYGLSNQIVVNDHSTIPNQGAFIFTSGAILDSGDLYLEAITTKFKKTLLPNQCYKLSFKSANVPELPSIWDNQPFKLRVMLSNTSMALQDSIVFGGPSFHTGIVIAEPILNVSNNAQSFQWNNTDVYFSPAQSVDYIALRGVLPNNNSLSIYTYMDNLSVKQVASSFCPGSSISGVVYNDNVITNGQISLGEQVLESVVVRLYDLQNNLINVTNTDAYGAYKFLNLSPASSYKVVLASENIYQAITEPLANNSFNGVLADNTTYAFQNVRSVSFTNGQTVTGENFGVLYQGQTTQNPPTISPAPMCSTGGSLTANAPSGLTGGITFSWSGPNGFTGNQQTVVATAPGIYTVTVTSSAGYSSSASHTVLLPAATQVTPIIVVPTSGNDGSISLIPNGQGPFIYLWANNGGASANRTNLGSGTYSVTVTNANGCASNHIFTLYTPPTITPALMCSNGGNLSANAPSGTTGTISYAWSGPTNGFTSSQQTISATAAGTYTVNVTSTTGYLGSASHTVQLPAPSVVTPTIVPAISGNNGSISLNVTGQGPFTYLWANNGGTTQNRTNLAAGTYSVTITNANGCTSQHSFIVGPSCASAPPTTNYNTTSTPANNVPLFSCYGELFPNGAMECRYNYAAPGTAGGWNASCPASVAGTNCCGWRTACPSTVVDGAITNASNGANGGVALTISGSGGPFTYQWSNGQTTQNLTNVAAGEYTVTVKNANGCQTQKSFVVHNQMTVTLSKNEGCSQAQNTITSTATGGVAPYTHRFSQVNGLPNIHVIPNAPATATYSNVAPGTYSVEVVDANGQSVQGSTVTIAPYTAPNIYWSKTDATATAFNNGKITVNVQGGVSPFSYIFTGSSPLTVSNQSASTYTREPLAGSNTNLYNVQVKDARHCLSNQVSNIKVLRKLNAPITSVVRRCEGTVVSARVNITPPTGGHGPYTYAVNGVPLPAGQTFFNATANSSLTITDSSTPTAQTFTHPVTVTPIPPAHTVSVAVVNTTSGLSNGSATVTTTAGLGPYTYSYTPGTAFTNIPGNTHPRTGLAAGTYSVNVTTANGCSVPKSFVINASATAAPVIKN